MTNEPIECGSYRCPSVAHRLAKVSRFNADFHDFDQLPYCILELVLNEIK